VERDPRRVRIVVVFVDRHPRPLAIGPEH
jgi:hypothetical protein